MRPRSNRGRLVSAARSSSFPPYLRRLGYREDGHRFGVDPKRHVLHHAGGAPAVTEDALRWYVAHGVPEIVVHLTDGSVLRITVATFLERREPCEYAGFELQWVVHRRFWVHQSPTQLSMLA